MKMFIRWWYLLFRKKACIKIIMEYPYNYGDTILVYDGSEYKCLGKNWYYRIGVYNLYGSPKHFKTYYLMSKDDYNRKITELYVKLIDEQK